MSESAKKAFEEAQREILEESRDCGWCGKRLTTVDTLVLHIWDYHGRKGVPDSTYRLLVKKINQPE